MMMMMMIITDGACRGETDQQVLLSRKCAWDSVLFPFWKKFYFNSNSIFPI